MDKSNTVTVVRRLFLAGISMVLAILVTTAILTMRDVFRMPDTDWHSMGGNIQLVLFYLLVQGIVAAVTYPVFTVPLVLLFPATAQIKYWYGFLTASLLWLPWATLCLRFIALKSLAEIGGKDWYLTYLFVDFPAFVSCCLYLLLLRHAQKRREAKSGSSDVATR